MRRFVPVIAAVAALAPPALADVYVRVAPPPPQVEVIPEPRLGYVWTPGYWQWRGRRHVWVDGHWVRARAGYRWAPDVWYNDGGRWIYTRGHWVRDY